MKPCLPAGLEFPSADVIRGGAKRRARRAEFSFVCLPMNFYARVIEPNKAIRPINIELSSFRNAYSNLFRSNFIDNWSHEL